MQLTVKYGDKVLFEKEVTLSDRQQARITEMVTLVTMTNDERIAQSQAQTAIAEAQMTPSQKAERALFSAMSPKDRQIVMLVSHRDGIEARLDSIIK
jgi:hypothetical protein